jgi:hypothetical protein
VPAQIVLIIIDAAGVNLGATGITTLCAASSKGHSLLGRCLSLHVVSVPTYYG